MNLKKVATIILLTFVLSTAFMVLSPTLAQTNDNAQKQKTETLLGILDKDKTSLATAFSRLDVQNINVPQTAETAYNEGIAYAEEASSLMGEENFSEASAKAVEAMQKFEATLKLLENASPVTPTETDANAEEAISLKSNITRVLEYVRWLENLTAKSEATGYNTVAIEKRLSEVKWYLENALRELRARNLDGAAEQLSIAKTLLDELRQPFVRLINLVKETNTERYLEAAEIRVSVIKTNITDSATLTSQIKEDAISALNNSELNLAKARDLIESNNVDDAVGELEEAKNSGRRKSNPVTNATICPVKLLTVWTNVTEAATE